ncbi:nuclear factor erythroid 2-related factor 3 [Ctenodactylus gundi]
MKLPKPWWAAGGGLLPLAVLLSLAGLRVHPDLYLLPPPPALLRDEPPLPPGGPARPARALGPFPAPGGWGRAGPLHPKGREADAAAPPEGRLLREVRALGVPFIPRTRVDAWLVHSVAAGAADGAHGPLGAAASSVGGGVAGVDGGSPAAPGDGGDPGAAHSRPVAAEEEEKEPAAQVPDARGRATQENEVLREKCETEDHSSEQEHNEERVSAWERSLQQNDEEENKTVDEAEREAADTPESRSERQLNRTDTSLSLEDLFQLISSQPEYSLEDISLEDISPLPGNISDGMNSSIPYNVNFSQAISHDVNLHEAMMCPNNPLRREPVSRTSQAQEPFLQLNFHSQQMLPRANSTGFLPPVDNQMRNLTSQDLLYDLDANVFDEIMSLTTDDFNPVEVSQLFEEPDSDSGLSLNSSPNSNSMTLNFSDYNEGAVGYSCELENLCPDLQGAVGGYCPQPSKHRHMNHESGLQDLSFQHVLHNHTYHLPSTTQPNSELFPCPGKSQKMSMYFEDTERNLSRDEQRAKALHIPFSVDEIVRMPVDSFNSMLSRHYLSELQISLIRDIRRRGKNKVAAQNCRKRKLDMILNLEDEVCNLQARKETLQREQAQCNKAINIMKQKLHKLYHNIFSRLRDDQGRPVSPNQYILQCSHNGTVLIVPKELVTSSLKKDTHKAK